MHVYIFFLGIGYSIGCLILINTLTSDILIQPHSEFIESAYTYTVLTYSPDSRFHLITFRLQSSAIQNIRTKDVCVCEIVATDRLF